MKELFSLENHVSYLNCSYMSPLLKVVEEAGRAAVSSKARPYEIGMTDFFDAPEIAKQKFAKLINVDDSQRIALIASVSYGMANVAKNIPFESGEEILVIDEQFPSNMYCWQRRCLETGAQIRVAAPPAIGKGRGKKWNEAILQSINPKTKVVAMPHVHWADGTLFDLAAIRKKATECGALLVIDGTQSVGALAFDVTQFKPDALICAAYKWLLGPYSSGFAYYGEFFDDGIPIEENWINRKDSDNFKELVNYQPKFRQKANRYNVGEYSNFIAIPMLDAALTQLLEWGTTQIQSHCEEILHPFIADFEALGCFIESPDYRGHHLFGIHLPASMDLDKLSLAFKEANVSVSLRGNAVRVSPHLYNDKEDVEKLLACFQKSC